MELLGKERKDCFRQLYLPLEGRVRGLTMQVASLMLIKSPQTDQFKIPVLWAAQTVVRLASKSWWGLAKVTLYRAFCFFLTTINVSIVIFLFLLNTRTFSRCLIYFFLELKRIPYWFDLLYPYQYERRYFSIVFHSFLVNKFCVCI